MTQQRYPGSSLSLHTWCSSKPFWALASAGLCESDEPTTASARHTGLSKAYRLAHGTHDWYMCRNVCASGFDRRPGPLWLRCCDNPGSGDTFCGVSQLLGSCNSYVYLIWQENANSARSRPGLCLRLAKRLCSEGDSGERSVLHGERSVLQGLGAHTIHLSGWSPFLQIVSIPQSAAVSPQSTEWETFSVTLKPLV
jgi:hypothetical protein